MNFSGHAKGAVAAGAVAMALAAASGQVAPDSGLAAALAGDPLGSASLRTLAGVFLTAAFMALFPDLDTASVPQRWFLRAMFALLVLTHLAGRYDLFALLAFCALLPLLHRHRGWTHWRVTPWLIPVFLAAMFEAMRARGPWLSGFSWQNVRDLMAGYWVFVAAVVIGHYTHLLLDARRVRWLPFIRNPPHHH